MKKIIASIMLSLFMCLTMVFPASASTYKPEYEEYFLPLYNSLQSKIASSEATYPYKLYFYNTSGSYQITLFMLKKPTFNVGDSFIWITSTRNTNGTSNAGAVSAAKILNNQPYFQLMGSPSTIPSIRFETSAGTFNVMYLASDYSTATLVSDKLSFTESLYYDYTMTLIPPIDISGLVSLITQAMSMQNNGYTSASWQILQNHISDAENLLSTTGYTQTEVDSQTAALQAAIDNLVRLPSLDGINALITEADAITDIGYTSVTWNRFTAARSSAHALVVRTDYTESEVTAVSTELQTSMYSLALASITPAPETPSVGGYDLGTGDIGGYLAPAYGIFVSYVISVSPVVISLFGILFSIKLAPRMLRKILRILRR